MFSRRFIIMKNLSNHRDVPSKINDSLNFKHFSMYYKIIQKSRNKQFGGRRVLVENLS